MTAVADPPITRPGRVIGVDVARGVALFGMMATHVYDAFRVDGTPMTSTVLASGRSAATFALVAGVSVAFLTGGRNAVQGTEHTAAAMGLTVRALLIGAVGLLLGFAGSGISLILPYYAVMFLLAIPLLRLRPRTLALLSAMSVLLAPVLLLVTTQLGLDYTGRPNPTLVTVFSDPGALLVQLFLTGSYPVVAYMAYLCAGMAIGRLDLRSRRVAERLLVGGIALAVISKAVSYVLLYPLGGLDRLIVQNGPSGGAADAATFLLWDPQQGSSWWYLALASPHANTQLDVAHTLGSAMAVLGAALLVTRVAAVRDLTWPVAAAGAMTLTLYSAHVLVLESEVLETDLLELGLTVQYIVLVAASLVFAVVWRRRHDQGPLEKMVAVVASRARDAVLSRSATPVGAPERE